MDELEIIMFKEIDDYSEKFYGLTFRQWVFSILIAIVVVPTYILLPKYTPISSDVASYFVIAEAGVIGFFGFIKIHNLSAEKLVPYWYRHFFKFSKPITYITDKEWEEMHDKDKKKNKKQTESSVKTKTGNDTTDKQTEIKEKNESKPKLTKKQIKQQQKREKMLKKAKKKYGYLLDDDTTETVLPHKQPVASSETNYSGKIDEESKRVEETVILNNTETENDKHNNDVQENNISDSPQSIEEKNVADNTKDDVLNSLTNEQKQALLKMLNNG